MFKQKKRIAIGLALTTVIIAGTYMYAHFNPENHHFFPKCPVFLLTGYQCPGCGSQRAFYHLFHGNIATAFRYNPFVLLLAPYVITGIIIEYVANRNNPRIVRLRELLFGKWAVLVLAVFILLFTIFRNL